MSLETKKAGADVARPWLLELGKVSMTNRVKQSENKRNPSVEGYPQRSIFLLIFPAENAKYRRQMVVWERFGNCAAICGTRFVTGCGSP